MELLIIILIVHILYTVYNRLYIGYFDKSYSDTFYKLVGYRKIFFWGWILGISIPGIYYLRDISWISAYGAFFVLGVLFTSYTVQKKHRTIFHVISATGGMLLILAGFVIHLANWTDWNVFNYGVIAVVITSIILLPIEGIKKGIPSHTYWIEFAFVVEPILILIINERLT